jgi:hypothetical protein
MVKGTAVTLIPVADRASHWEVLDAADAIVFGCPTYMGSGSAALKAFMEETIQPQFLEQRWKDKLVAGFTNSAGMSGDKLLALQQLSGFAAQHGMIWITLGQLPGWQTSVGSDDDLAWVCARLGLEVDNCCVLGTGSHIEGKLTLSCIVGSSSYQTSINSSWLIFALITFSPSDNSWGNIPIIMSRPITFPMPCNPGRYDT